MRIDKKITIVYNSGINKKYIREGMPLGNNTKPEVILWLISQIQALLIR